MTMGLGKLTRFAEIREKRTVKDSEGFTAETEVTLASVRCYREGRHGSKFWANLAAFSEASDLFCFRRIPGVSVTTDHALVCDGDRFDIISVETVRGNGLYVEVLAKKVVSSHA